MAKIIWDVEKDGCINRNGELVPNIGVTVPGLHMYEHWRAYEPELRGALLEAFLDRLGDRTGFRPYTWQIGTELARQSGCRSAILQEVFAASAAEDYLRLQWIPVRPIWTLIHEFLKKPSHWVLWKGRTFNAVDGEYLGQDNELLNQEMSEARRS